MKQFKMTGKLLKSIALAGLLAACNHDDRMVTPTATGGTAVNDRNAKISPLTRLVKDGDKTIQYIKSGKFLGKVSAVDEGPSGAYRYEYSYDDNNPAGDLWISKKKFIKATNTLQQEWKYKESNGLCVFSETGPYHFEYKYTPQGYLDEVKNFQGNSVKHIYKYSYGFSISANAYRLAKVSLMDINSKLIHEYLLTYISTIDKYATPFETDHTDKYIPSFGKQSDVLIDQITSNWADPNALDSKNKFNYLLDSDGLVIEKSKQTSLGNNPYSPSQTSVLKYSDNWQGI